jgi:hypothetical protein
MAEGDKIVDRNFIFGQLPDSIALKARNRIENSISQGSSR